MVAPTRGDIVTAAGGVYASKPRPVVVLQDDLFSASDSVTVCPLTTKKVDAPLLRMPLAADEANGTPARTGLVGTRGEEEGVVVDPDLAELADGHTQDANGAVLDKVLRRGETTIGP